MLNRTMYVRLGVTLAMLAPVAAARAEGESAAAETARINELQSMIEAQQKQIESLEARLVASEQKDQDAARVEAMRQQIRAVLSEQEFRESLMPSTMLAGYDNGFYIRSSDDNFEMKVNGGMEFRWTYYNTQSTNRYRMPGVQRDDRTGFDVQRLRLSLSGHVYSKDLTYLIDIRADSPDGYTFNLNQAWVNYRFADEFQFRAGYFDLVSTRAQWNGWDAQSFVDRTMFDTVYGLGYSIGVRFWGQLFDKRLEYYLDVVNSLSNDQGGGIGRTITNNDPPQLDGNPAILFRAVYHALGDHPETDFVKQYDIEFHENPALDFGFSYAFNADEGDQLTTRVPAPLLRPFRTGAFALTTTNEAQINQWSIDSAFKWRGFSAIGEYAIRTIDPRRAGGSRPFTPWWLATGDGSTTAQQGAYVQAGYFLPIPGLEKKLEIVARVSGISALAEEQDCAWEYAAGANYYIKGDRVKLQADVTKIPEVPMSAPYSSMAVVNDDALVFRVQLLVAF